VLPFSFLRASVHNTSHSCLVLVEHIPRPFDDASTAHSTELSNHLLPSPRRPRAAPSNMPLCIPILWLQRLRLTLLSLFHPPYLTPFDSSHLSLLVHTIFYCFASPRFLTYNPYLLHTLGLPPTRSRHAFCLSPSVLARFLLTIVVWVCHLSPA
jgi:hypothetical protein